MRTLMVGMLALACDSPPGACDWEEHQRFVAPGEGCVRYYVTHGSDSCVKVANDNDCACDSEVTVTGGTEVVWMYRYFNQGGIGLQWEPAECP